MDLGGLLCAGPEFVTEPVFFDGAGIEVGSSMTPGAGEVKVEIVKQGRNG